jgi:hypothetical protein
MGLASGWVGDAGLIPPSPHPARRKRMIRRKGRSIATLRKYYHKNYPNRLVDSQIKSAVLRINSLV